MPPVTFQINITSQGAGISPGQGSGANIPGGGTAAGLENYLNAQTLLTFAKIGKLESDEARRNKSLSKQIQEYALDRTQIGLTSGVANLTGSNTLGALTSLIGGKGITSPTLGYATLALSSFVETVKSVDQRMMSLADTLVPFSATIALASAQADVTRFRAELRRADALGPDTARYIRARTEIEVAFMDLKTAILGKLIPHIADMAEATAEVTPGLLNIFSSGEGWKALIDVITAQMVVAIMNAFGTSAMVQEAMKDLEKARKALEDIAGKTDVEDTDFMKDLNDFFRQRKDPGAAFFGVDNAPQRFIDQG